MLRISSIQFVYDQANKVAGYRVAFDGEGSSVEMLSGSIELNSDEANLSNIATLVQEKLASVLETSD